MRPIAYATLKLAGTSAKARGIYKGGKARIDPEAVRKLASEGVRPSHIARQLGISRGTVRREIPS
ncbi:helix-turn-helix domain-containing protein [Sphingomonas aerophila]|uniref:DNA invertase Pin-like site-specific DNA recombinase n=1 Tax=Sphingomonas aerophila TaxID=1344948 RepID=A0A7W9BH89_9SPHN|nr:helix-turn-helix domain-containing protein [Sphingomonas aerophila]MBB5716831.1 DNA invertase Pin-like site-specific DNA recombinase [Sphingomonas aerophila]